MEKGKRMHERGQREDGGRCTGREKGGERKEEGEGDGMSGEEGRTMGEGGESRGDG